MTYKTFKSPRKKSTRKIKKRYILLLVFVPVFLLGTSFFVFAAAQGNASEKAVEYWNENRDEISVDYFNGELSTEVAGIIKFDEKTTVPYYTGMANVDSNAVLFGGTLPGQTGRSVILGQNENEFAYLSQMKIGDEIKVESWQGQFVYVVNTVNVVVPSEIPLFETEDSVLTLVTQYPFRTLAQANRRYVVEAVLLQ